MQQPGRLEWARVGIVTILDPELEALKAAFRLDLFTVDGTYFVDGQRRPNVVIRQSPGRAHVATLGATKELIEHFRPELILVVGIAGGIEGRGKVFVGDRKVPVATGDVVVPEYLHYSEFVKLIGGVRQHRYVAYDQPSASIRDQFVRAALHRKNWLDRRSTEDKAIFSPKVIVDCSLVAGEKLLSDPTSDEQKRIVEFFTDAAAVDMESVAVARAAYEARCTVDYNPRLLVIRGISDLIRSGQAASDKLVNPPAENDQEREKWTPLAARAAAIFAQDVVQDFLAKAPDPRS